jgi:hypothetical protein
MDLVGNFSSVRLRPRSGYLSFEHSTPLALIAQATPQKAPLEPQQIKHESDYQRNWNRLIPRLQHLCDYEAVNFLTIVGDAPKDFITDTEYRPGHRSRRKRSDSYIAKIGIKYYPNESITEQLITHIGQAFRIEIAESKLRIVAGQVRFMSRYFLDRRKEQLTHGAEIFEISLGKQEYQELADKKIERSFFTFRMTIEAMNNAFPEFKEKLMSGFVKMLAFDALIGHNDRHPYNWGVIVPIHKSRPPRFSPLFDTARALFWNISDAGVKQMLADDRALGRYIDRCTPPICWEKEQRIGFFRLIKMIWMEFPRHRAVIECLLDPAPLQDIGKLLRNDFSGLMSAARRELIQKCLTIRQQRLKEACKP